MRVEYSSVFDIHSHRVSTKDTRLPKEDEMRQIIFRTCACVLFLISLFALPTTVCADAFDKLRAETHLKRLRDHTSPRPTFEFLMLTVNLTDGKLHPSDIGTSAQELEELRAAAPKREALVFLQRLREGKSLSPVVEFGFIQQNLALAELEPEAIGTSAQELETLRVEAHSYMATLFLAKLRDGSTEPLLDLSLLWEYLQAGGLTFSDIGTSRDELMEISCGIQCRN